MDVTVSILRGLIPLAVMLAAAAYLSSTRELKSAGSPKRHGLSRIAIMAILIQLAHFIEELKHGFEIQFPELLGLEPWPVEFFATFNIFWLLIWLLAVLGLRRDVQIAYFPLWFLAIAMIANALAHPMMAVAEGGYFPGLWTSPFSGIFGFFLLRELFAQSARR